MDHLGERLREVRKLKHVSQKLLSLRTGLAESHLSRIENGRLTATLHTYQSLATGLGVDISALISAQHASGERAEERLMVAFSKLGSKEKDIVLALAEGMSEGL